MRFAGIDFDTHRVVVCALDPETLVPIAGTIPLVGADAFERTRKVAGLAQLLGWWDRAGIVQAAIEQPISRSDALYRVQGAILALIPGAVPVMELPPWEWRKTLGLPGSGRRDDVKRTARDWALAQPYGETLALWSQDSIDAYCIARAALTLCERGAAIA